MTQRVQKRPKFDASSRIRSLEERLAEVEQRVRNLEKRTTGEDLMEIIPHPTENRRGRKPKQPWDIFSKRDELIEMLEDHWPELQPLFARPIEHEQIKRELTRLAEPKHGGRGTAAVHLVQNFDKLIEVLSHARYRGDPRHVANAMAGVPEISWWRSLKVCGANAPMKAVSLRALRDYVRRKRPEIAEQLDTARDTLDFAVIWKRVRTKDRELLGFKSDARFAQQAWQAGEAQQHRLPDIRL